MAEEKKDAFTFSDKIKNSKPAFNPFSKRVSSKIGNNGKPKKTLFERTRRDAPFFIAALAALLMLPFLYKYSGSVSEGEAIVAPGMSDTVFDPERFDFSPSMEDSSGQISQLTGRDPLSLIKGWGTTTTTDESARYDYDDRDGFADYSARDNNTNKTTTVNTIRRRIPKATRAAFQRAPTKVNELRGAGLNTRGGGGPGSRFGGASLRAAAKKDSSGPLRQPTKPVSLQPLRAAGSPSRSYYGQDGVAQARASRDALSKADAQLALKDAVFEPVKSGRVGGLTDGMFAAGGGPGQMERNMDFKGITPWWWDMMKDREQTRWKYNFELFRKPFAELLAKVIAGEIGCCIATGDSSCEAGSFFGTKGKAAGDPTCEVGKIPTKLEDFCSAYGNESWAKGPCSENLPMPQRLNNFKFLCEHPEKANENGVKIGVWDGNEGKEDAGFIKTRLDCMGGVRSKGAAGLEAACDPVNLRFSFDILGKAAWWKKNTYHIVLAENENGLCDASSSRNVSSVTGVEDSARRYNRGHVHKRVDGENEHVAWSEETKTSDLCVIYVARGLVMDYEDYLYQIDKVAKEKGIDATQIKPRYVRGYAMAEPLGNLFNTNLVTSLPIMKKMPMSEQEFVEKYLRMDRKAMNRSRIVQAQCDLREQVVPPSSNPVIEETPNACQEGEQEVTVEADYQGCKWIRKCVKEGDHWNWGEPEKEDPNCGQSDEVTIIGFDGQIPDCNELNDSGISSKQLVAVDGSIKQLLKDAQTKYNNANKTTQLQYNEGGCVTIANVYHAMKIVQNGIPLNAVCMLGKSIGANTQDPYVKEPGYNNMFGTFAAYMGVDSAYFPTQYLTRNSKDKELDPRSYWCFVGAGDKALVSGKQIGTHNDNHYGLYVSSRYKGPRPEFVANLNSGVWSGFPLKAIADAVGWTPAAVKNNNTIKENRNAYHKAYQKVFGEGSCGLQGTMSFAEVQKYIKQLCREGSLNRKPGSGRNVCDSRVGVGTGDHQTMGGTAGGTTNCPQGNC